MTQHPHILIRASAGTGKTFQLSNRYLGLLDSGATPDQILATTFTRKAAGEILDRVILRLAEAATDTKKRRELAHHLGVGALSQDRCYQLLRSLIQHLHRLRICTLDAFFAQLATSFSLELGLPPGWTIVEQPRDDALRAEAIERTLQSDSGAEVTRLIHLMAKGEARRSVSDLLRSTVDDLYNLYLETDAQAWHQIPRPRKLSGEQLARVIESLETVELPAHKTIEKTRIADLETASAGDWETFVSKGLAAKVLAGETVYCRKEIPEDAHDIYQQLIRHARAVLLEQMAQQTEATHELLDKFHRNYEQLKHQARVLRFEDVTRSLVGTEALGNINQQHFRLDTPLAHLLLDEFQDTSLLQWQVLEPLAEHVTQPEAKTRSDARPATPPSFFCVGDGKQAIYGWRGGRSEILDALEHQLDDLTNSSLNESYRSAQPIIDIVNTVFTRMARHDKLEHLAPAVQHWCNRFQPHTTARKELAGYAELITAPQADRDAGESQLDITLAYAADRIQLLVQEAPGFGIGVLVRRNTTVAQLIYELRARGVPASEEGGHPLTDSPAVQLVLSLLKLVDHPGDHVARFHLAHSPLGAELKLLDHDDTVRVLEVAGRVRHELLEDGYGPTVYRISQQLMPSCDQRDRSRLSQLVDLAFGYQQMATLRASDFLDFVQSEGVADPTTAEVRVMTIHQAKGLQFDIVVLPELEGKLVGQADACVVGQKSPTDRIDRVCLYRNTSLQQLLPPELQQLFEDATRQSVQEALCVLYVALTRAVHALHMIIAPSAASEKSLHKTAAGLLRAALTEGQRLDPLNVAYRTGDPQWYRAYPKPELVEPAPATSISVLEPARITLAPPLAGSKLEAQAPSKLEGGGRIPVASLLDLRSHVATSRGTLIHAWFEQIVWLDDGPPERDALRRIARRLDIAGLDVDTQLAALDKMLAMPGVAQVLSRAFYEPPWDASLRSILPDNVTGHPLRVEVRNEQQFATRDEDRLMRGYIDRLVLLYDGDQLVAADIIDYKTDSVAADDADAVRERVEYYHSQLDAYRRGVARMFHLPIDRIATRLLFLSPGILCTVSPG